MPALGAVDPADLRAQARAELGLSREWRSLGPAKEAPPVTPFGAVRSS